jgi:hypothetical protein
MWQATGPWSGEKRSLQYFVLPTLFLKAGKQFTNFLSLELLNKSSVKVFNLHKVSPHLLPCRNSLLRNVIMPGVGINLCGL